jgi:hypothetical protein
MPQNLDTLLAQVNDEKTFISFVQALATDFEEEKEIESSSPSSPYSSGALGWENGTIDNMLGAAAAWGLSTAMNPANKTSEQNPWRRCAHILYAGKFYE